MKFQFKSSDRNFWYITYEVIEREHHIVIQCERWKMNKVHLHIPESYEEVTVFSTNELMMEIATMFSNIGLQFANGVQDCHTVDKFDFEE